MRNFLIFFVISFILIAIFGLTNFANQVQAACNFYSATVECSGRNNSCTKSGNCTIDCGNCPPPNQYSGSCPLGIEYCGDQPADCSCGSAACIPAQGTCNQANFGMCGACKYGYGGCNQGPSACTSCNNAGDPRACCQDDAYRFGCTWNGSSCSGDANSYQCYQGGVCTGQQSTAGDCTSSNCFFSSWTQNPDGSYCPPSSCTNGACQDTCSQSHSCTPTHYYTAIAPTGAINTITPTLEWNTDNVIASGTYTCLGVFAGSNCPGSYLPGLSACPPVSSRAFSTSNFSASLQPNTNYSWNVYGKFTDGYYSTSNCLNFTTPNPSCQISLSPSALTVSVGGSQTITATVSNITGGTLGSVTWSSANPAIATVNTPGNPSLVNGISAGSTTITATANLSPSGSCTSVPTSVTVVSAYFQTFGGDVTFKGALSDPNLPLGTYISGR